MDKLVDDSAFTLGMLTPLEMYKRHRALLETELDEAYRDARNGRRRTA